MPRSVSNAVSAGIMPKSLCTALAETREIAMLANVYKDGSCQRKNLAETSRKRFQISKRLTTAQLNELYDFYISMIGKAFVVYPLASDHDPSGQSLEGRYLCRFDGRWADSIGVPRHDTDLQLVELA